MFPFYLPLPAELLNHVSQILWKHQLFKVRESLDIDGVFHRHIEIVKYIRNSQFYQVPWQQQMRIQGSFGNSTLLCFRQDPIPDRSQVIATAIDLKGIREAVEEMKGKVMPFV